MAEYRDDGPAIQAAIEQAREHPGEPVPVAGTDVTVTWLPGLVPGSATISYSPGTLHIGGAGNIWSPPEWTW